MSIRVEEYICLDGTNPYKTWFDSLDAQAAAKVVTAKLRMELGNTSNVKWFAGIGEMCHRLGAWLPHISCPGWRFSHCPVRRRHKAPAIGRYRPSQGITHRIQVPESP